MQTKKKEIAIFLKDFKKIASNKGILTIPRVKNRNALAELGLTKKERNREIMSLSVTDYCEGPKSDHNKDGNIWIFGKEIDGKGVYIKLKTDTVGDEKIAKCLSFHSASFPLKFPYK